MHELETVLNQSTPGKSPGRDGVLVEFLKIYWTLIKEDYLSMIRLAVDNGHFPPRVNVGVLTFLHKGNFPTELKLPNWRPIALLNVAYTLYAKTLQLRLQPVLNVIISEDQSAFYRQGSSLTTS